MAIIPLALCTMPLMRKVSTIRPAFPGGRFSGGALVWRALVSRVSKGSRRTTVLFSSAGFSAGVFELGADATFVASLAAAGAFTGAFAGAFVGAFAGALAAAGPGCFSGAAGGA